MKKLEIKQMEEIQGGDPRTAFACGFGVGLSWASVYFETDKIVVSELQEI